MTAATSAVDWPAKCSATTGSSILYYADAKHSVADSTLPTLTLLFSILGILINSAFVFFVVHGIREKQLPYRNYVLLLNRSIVDVVIAFFTTLFVTLKRFETMQYVTGDRPIAAEGSTTNGNVHIVAPSSSTSSSSSPFTTTTAVSSIAGTTIEYIIPHGRTLFTLMLTVNFWSVAGSYAVLALFTYVAVRYPVYYKVYLTKRKVSLFMFGLWLIGVIYSILVVSLSANDVFDAFQSSADVIQSVTVSDEDYALSISNLMIVIISLLLVTTSYVAIIIYLWKTQRSTNGNGSALRSLMASTTNTMFVPHLSERSKAQNAQGQAGKHMVNIGRLGLNVVAFTMSCIVMAGFVSLPLFLKGYMDTLSHIRHDSLEEKCNLALKTFKLSYNMIVWTTVAMTCWLARMFLDPLANFLLDKRFGDVIRSALKSKKRGFYRPQDFKKRIEVANEFLQKCVDANIMPLSVASTNGHYYRSANTANVPQDAVKLVQRYRYDTISHVPANPAHPNR